MLIQEVESALRNPQQAALFCQAYNIKREGNTTLSEMSDPHGEFGGKNVPILLTPISELAQELSLPEDSLHAQLAGQRKILHAVRSTRPRPGLDDKVGYLMSSWQSSAGRFDGGN